MKTTFTFMLVLTLCCSFNTSFSQMRTLYIKGAVSQIDDADNTLTGVVQMGDTLRGTVKYDLSITDGNGDPTIADYDNTTTPAGIVLSTDNSDAFQTDSNNVQFLFEIGNDFLGEDDALIFNNYTTLYPHQLAIDPNGVNQMSWSLFGLSSATLNSVAMPTYITLSDWQQPTTVSIEGDMLNGSHFTFDVTITAVDTIAPDVVTSVAAIEKNGLQVYPNPVKDKLVIGGNASAKGTIEILNLLGQVIFQTEFDDRKTEINVSFFPQGLYFLKLQSESKVVIKNFVKE